MTRSAGDATPMEFNCAATAASGRFIRGVSGPPRATTGNVRTVSMGRVPLRGQEIISGTEDGLFASGELDIVCAEEMVDHGSRCYIYVMPVLRVWPIVIIVNSRWVALCRMMFNG